MDNSSINGDRIIDFNSNPDIGVPNILEDKSNPLPVSTFHFEFYFPFKILNSDILFRIIPLFLDVH